MVLSTTLLGALLVVHATALPQGDLSNVNWDGSQPLSPDYPWLFENPLPIPHEAKPIYTERVDGRVIHYFEMTIEPFDVQVYPDLGPAHFVGYNGSFPGPTFRIEIGEESIVRLSNRAPYAATMHLHGSPSRAPWDGWAEDLIQPGEYKDYYYPNIEPSPLWYHDHVGKFTARDVYNGQAGVYLVHEPKEDDLGLPDPPYDVPLAISDAAFQANGDLSNLQGNIMNFFGDIILVNGQPWPYMNVEPRKYRLRFYEMSLSRPYVLSFVPDGGEAFEFDIIASDVGLFEYPVTEKELVIAMGERYELIVDFAPFKGSNITLVNSGMQDPWIPMFKNTDKVMRFVVGDSVTDNSNNGPVPSHLKDIIRPNPKGNAVDHEFNFVHGGDNFWSINGAAFNNRNSRVLANFPQGATEVWQFNYRSGPGIHPIHIHLVNFQVLERISWQRGVLPQEVAGLKDTILMNPGESVKVAPMFGPWNGVYVFHCHNLIHEDYYMMDVFNATILEELGYQFNSTYGYTDPKDPRYTARPISPAAFEPAAIQSKISSLGALGVYASASALLAAERSYYATATYTATYATQQWPSEPTP